MDRISLNALFAASIALAMPVLAEAQSCAPRDTVLSQLAEEYDEHRLSIGIAANGLVVETFASETGSWTIVFTRPDGMSCLIASGASHERFEPPAGGEPA